MTQFSLFGAAVAEPSVDDLDGVLLGGGHWVRSRQGARLSVVVADRWRAEALAQAFAERDLACDTEAAGPAVLDAHGAHGEYAVRTAFTPALAAAAQRWIRGANEGPPPDFRLEVGGLRLWAVTSGRRDELGYLLGTAEPDGPVHRAAGAQLARLGIAAVELGVRGGPGWRVTSAKRLRRLAETLGPAPEGAGPDWAGGAPDGASDGAADGA